MEEKKRKNTWIDAVAIVLAVVLGQTVSEAVPVESEMLTTCKSKCRNISLSH